MEALKTIGPIILFALAYCSLMNLLSGEPHLLFNRVRRMIALIKQGK